MEEKENTPAFDENLDFHYNRAERLKRAPENVKEFYDGTAPKPPKGLFKALVHTSHGKFMLGAVFLSLAVVFVVFVFGEKANIKSAAGITFTLSAFSFEDSVYVSLKADDGKDREELPLTAEMIFSALNAEKEVVIEHKNMLIYEGKEKFYRTIFTDYDIMSVQTEIRVGTESVKLHTRVEQR